MTAGGVLHAEYGVGAGRRLARVLERGPIRVGRIPRPIVISRRLGVRCLPLVLVRRRTESAAVSAITQCSVASRPDDVSYNLAGEPRWKVPLDIVDEVFRFAGLHVKT